jgi:serine phosphatase RsbU (regulator of sigma subunit)
MLGEQEVDALGIPFAELWPQSERGRLERLIGSLESVGLGGAGETFERGDQAFEITGSRFQIRSGESGAILVLQDVTQRVAAERELRDTARTLQESLLPPHLPAMPRVELAAEFRPAGGGLEVGGDFYDMFEIAEDQWAIVIGDVCGKGAQAAALTALTRYTVRAAAMYEETAGGVLRVLNQALLRQQEDFTFTTLAYCQLDLRSEPSRLRVAVGGHPLPLLLRADGLAETVGRGGPLLGVLPGAEYADVEIAMQVGDMLVLYTDGLADARAPARLTTERDLLAELQRSRGLSAAQTVAQLEKFALAGSRETPRDDIAVIVAKVTM